jgi:hypothetical protein
MLPEEVVEKAQATPTAVEGYLIDRDVGAVLYDRLCQLNIVEKARMYCSEDAAQPILVWVIIETCRNCAEHATNLRHDEREYKTRYSQLKDAIEHNYPVGVKVEPLIPWEEEEKSSLCTSRWPQLGDHVQFLTDSERPLRDAFGNKRAWKMMPGEVAMVLEVNKEGDFRLCNAHGLESDFTSRKFFAYSSKDTLELKLNARVQALPGTTHAKGYAEFDRGTVTNMKGSDGETSKFQIMWDLTQQTTSMSFEVWRNCVKVIGQKVPEQNSIDGQFPALDAGCCNRKTCRPTSGNRTASRKPMANPLGPPAWRPPSLGLVHSQEVEAKTKGTCMQAGRIRIGSFEVFLCCTAPLVLTGGTPLVEGRSTSPSCQPSDHGHKRDEFLGICIASKLRSRTWPVKDAILSRLSAVMPSIPLKVNVHTSLELPVPGIQLAVCPVLARPPHGHPDSTRVRPMNAREQQMPLCESMHRALATSQTDDEGVCEINVPACKLVRLQVWHEQLMLMQEKQLMLTRPYLQESFEAETVVQLWQVEEENELVVFCSSPRSSRGKLSMPGLEPFHGVVESNDGETLQTDSLGYLRGRPLPLCDRGLLVCDGWRSAPVSEAFQFFHGTGRTIELGRLGAPKVEASLVTPCCKACIPGATISVDGEFFGSTSTAVASVSCALRCGTHILSASHTLVPDGIKVPFTVNKSTALTTRGVDVSLALEKFRFCCVASTIGLPGSPKGGRGTSTGADLWLVGCEISEWRASRYGPSQDAQIWFWEGELRGAEDLSFHDEPPVLSVEAGVVSTAAVATLSSVSDQSTDNVSGMNRCIFSQALSLPFCTEGPWQTSIHPSGVCRGCTVAEIANLALTSTPAIWLGRLSDGTGGGHCRQRGENKRKKTSSTPRILLRTQCCGTGYADADIHINGTNVGKTDIAGELELPLTVPPLSRPSSGNSSSHGSITRRQMMNLKIDNVSACLLPGNTCEYSIHPEIDHDICLDMACLLWVYWRPPERPDQDDDSYDDDEDWVQDPEMPEKAAVWISASSAQVHDDALPLAGVLECKGMQGRQLQMDGQSVGPFVVHPEKGSKTHGCIISELLIHPVPIENHTYVPTEPSPLLDRCSELGGCELQRLAQCPCIIGYMVPHAKSMGESSTSSLDY